ncbi:glycosyl hydrolase [Rubripirellula amarantea]|nr:glycosyl hydrolase [Rubripirellula amarantea]
MISILYVIRATRCWIALTAIVFVCSPLVFSQDTKRGIGAGDGFLANSVNSRWAYDWNYDSPDAYNGEYVPMFWAGGNLSTKINAIKNYSNINYVLGFNEPERSDQANMTVANAVSQWATISNGFAGTGIKLVSPAVSDTVSGREWLADFMAEVDSDPNLVVDEIAFHWYGTVNINNPTATANSFLNKVDQYHTTYGRNVWVTEFAGLDFGGNYTTEQMQEWNATFLQTAIPGLESRSYVTRYGWWNHNDDSRLATKDGYGLWRPTQVGDYYNKTLLSGDSRDFGGSPVGLDMMYLRGGSLINDGSTLGNNAVGRIYAMANHDGSTATSSMGGTGDWGMHNWGSVRVEEGASLQKIGTNTVTWRNLDLYHDGEIRLLGGAGNTGTLAISGSGTNAQGTGQLRLDSGSHLKLGNAADANSFELPYDIQYRAGRVTVDSPVTLSGVGTIYNQTFFTTNDDLTVDGVLAGNNPGIVKLGVANMILNGDNTYVGYTRVNEGTLVVNGSIGGNDVLVNNGGTLGGTGQIAAMIDANNGGIVAPGNSPGTLTAGSADFAAGSTLSIELLSFTEFDRLVLNGPLVVDPGAILQIQLLGGYMPSVGDSFDVLDFASFSGSFGVIEAPALTNAQWDFAQFSSDGIIGVTAVPEPSGAAVSLLGMLAIVIYIRKRKGSRVSTA